MRDALLKPIENMITLPALFETVLQKSPPLNAAVHKSLDLFEPWLEQSGMPFFPGFTDHSPRHIKDVLETAASLVSDSSRDLLSAEDVTVLCMSILLHDCGMHLTQDGFRALISKTEPALISGLGDRPWHQIWNDFLGEANRFGQEKLVAIFGDAEPIRTELLNLDDLSERDCLLIGEFVRRHHARLAHEIALRGVPRRNGAPLELVGLDEEIRDLAGLVARSHGMSIRATFPYIEGRYGLVPEHRRIKTPFLMAVLRIADYVQVQSERALKSLLSVKELRSPVSRQEWRNHFAVRDVSTRHDDPEALYVHAAPTDVRTYLRLVALFKDIQRELDQSWATIGEVYGRRGDLAALGLSWRRIRSNLDKRDSFARTVPYIPIKAGFDASGPDLLKLLVGPLYDYSYEVGIRELVQNAVDACRELDDLVEREARRETEGNEYDVTVEVQESDDGTGWITITDKGVGMTLDTVTNYFLIAGASFRNSDVWKRQHVDEQGRSRVLRGGRFGVGALAAFLLGDEIRVRTRHIDREEADGLEFTARMDEPIVELRRCPAPSGTTIAVWVSDQQVFDKLRPMITSDEVATDPTAQNPIALESWRVVDWFAQSHPRIRYVWNGFNISQMRADRGYERRVRVRAEFSPSPNDVVPSPEAPTSGWHSLPESSPYAAVFWRYRMGRTEHRDGQIREYLASSEITVNGIRVQKVDEYEPNGFIEFADENSEHEPRIKLRRPSMAVFDPAGICPINLQRSAVAFDRMGIDDRLATDIIEHHIKSIVSDAQTCLSLSDFQAVCKKLANDETVKYIGQISPICATSTGITLSAAHALAQLEVKVLYFVNPKEIVEATLLEDLLEDGEALLLRQGDKGVSSDLSWFRGFFSSDASNSWYSSSAGFPYVFRRAATSLMPHKKWLAAKEKGKVNRRLLDTLQQKEHKEGYDIVSVGDAGAAARLVRRLDQLLSYFGDGADVSAWAVAQGIELPDQKPPLYRAWESAVGGPICDSQ